MNRNPYSEIESERLFLRRLKESDWEMISYLRSDKAINKFVARSGAESEEKALDFINTTNDNIEKQNLYYWCISKKNCSKMIGSICLWNFSENRKMAEVGYDLNPEFQGQGIMNEALTEILNFGYNILNVEKITAYTHRNNERSKRLLERNNFILMKDEIDKHNKYNVIYELKKTDC